MREIINISGYKFVSLDNLQVLRPHLLKKCLALELKGTILISPEGINIFMAGARENIDNFINFIRHHEKFQNINFKESISDHHPFNRTLVRIKKEIIAFGVPEVNPAHKPGRPIAPRVLKEWLDEGRDIILLDTRNEYEVKLGTFKNAVTLKLDTFRNFPVAVSKLGDSLREKTIVTFCTGGIRQEKAAPYLELKGYKDVYQIEGGILKYFEECGNAHWEGDCFVFDHRVALTPKLRQSNAKLCFCCRSPLTPEDLQDPAYVPAVSCRYCIH